MKERNCLIDVMRGIGIILVLLGHRSLPNIMVKMIYAFHMPLFFFISGYLYRKCEFGKFVSNKIKKIIIPYIIFWLISAIIGFFAYKSGIIDNFDFDKLVEQFVYYTPNGFWNGPLWFLPCLFVVEILFCFINQYLNKYSSLISFFVIPFLGYLCSRYNIYLIFKIDIAFTGLFFYSLGNYISNKRKLTNKFNKKYFLLDIPIFIISIFKFNNLIVQMIIGKYGNYILFLLNAVLGIYLTYQFACIIKDSFIFQTIGRESLIIMALHFIIYIIIFDPIQNKLYLNNFWIRNFVTILDVLICLLLCHIIYVFIYNKILLLLEKEKK